ncbi:AIPR protein [bacterium 1XD8-76]|nr:AIPR protein [bacterium 1XD8-76]
MAIVIEFPAKQVKKMDNPVTELAKDGSKKYVCYVRLQDVPEKFEEWMGTNPRDQKLTTNVARDIAKSIESGCKNFHEKNRGIVMSVDKFDYDNKTGKVKVTLTDAEIHGNIDGGHTLKIILEKQRDCELLFEQYVFFEFFTGISSPVELAEARNQSIQVDQRSIEELNRSFQPIKEALKNESFFDRIAFKQNEHAGQKNVIDIREIIAIMNMFNQSIYPLRGDTQPIQSYTGKEASLNRFLRLKDSRDQIIKNMTPIIPEIFNIWEMVETTFADKGNSVGRTYRKKKMSKYVDEYTVVSYSTFGDKPMNYVLPKGLIFPIVGAFRALVTVNKSTQVYSWKLSPEKVWNKLGGKLINTIMTSSEDLADSPDAVAKSPNTWDLLHKEILLYSMLSDENN